jgi:CDP-diacylglycerol--glycerol-3-phosphate 3-phosphatidyltransferase
MAEASVNGLDPAGRHVGAARVTAPPRDGFVDAAAAGAFSGLYAVKPAFVRRLRLVEDRLVARRVPADALTAAGLGAGVLAGAAVALGGLVDQPLLWLAVAPLGLARLALNALDGSVARRTGTDRPFGLALNEMADRLADAAMIGAIGLAGFTVLAPVALACALLVSLTGVLGTVVTGRRANGGPMGKADRVAVLGAASLGAAVAGSAAPLGAALWIVVVGSLFTATARLRGIAGAP